MRRARYARPLSEKQLRKGVHRSRVGGRWEQMGRLQLDFLVAHGLTPDSRVLDVACGALRAGIPLVGGRLDYLDGRVVAAIVYRRRLHPLNLFVRPAGADAPPEPITGKAEGYNLVRWTQGDLEYWVVSDLNARELQLFQQEFATATSR